MEAYIPTQLGLNRPHSRCCRNAHCDELLYLCGFHLPGNVRRHQWRAGYIAANAIMDDLRLDRPWTRCHAEWRMEPHVALICYLILPLGTFGMVICFMAPA